MALVLRAVFNGQRILLSTSDARIAESGQPWLASLSIYCVCQSLSVILKKTVPVLLYNIETRGKSSGYLSLMISNILSARFC